MIKRLLIICVLILSIATANAQGIPGIGACSPTGGAGAPSYQCTDATHDGANNAITLCEDFDGAASCADGYSSTCRNTWTVTKGDAGDTIDFDNATAPAPLIGTYSLRATSTTTTFSSIEKATGSSAGYYAHARLNIDTYAAPAADMAFLEIYRSNGSSVCRLGVDSTTGRFQIYTNGVTLHGSLSPSADTTYYIWLEWVRATSCAAFISTTTTKPETATLLDDTTIPDYDGYGIRVVVDESNAIVVDHIRTNTSAFGSNPQ